MPEEQAVGAAARAPAGAGAAGGIRTLQVKNPVSITFTAVPSEQQMPSGGDSAGPKAVALRAACTLTVLRDGG